MTAGAGWHPSAVVSAFWTLVVVVLISAWVPRAAAILDPAVRDDRIRIAPGTAETLFVAYQRSAFKDSTVNLFAGCANINKDSTEKFSVEFAIRSSGCSNEFDQVLNEHNRWMETYFMSNSSIPYPFSYPSLWYYRSSVFTVACNKGKTELLEATPLAEFQHGETHTIHYSDIRNSSSFPGAHFKKMFGELEDSQPHRLLHSEALHRNSGAESTFLKVPEDGVYLLTFKIQPLRNLSVQHTFFLQTVWRFHEEYLCPIDYPLLIFYGTMCGAYMILNLLWLGICYQHKGRMINVHIWITGIVFLALMEVIVWYAEYEMLDMEGAAFIRAATGVTCLRRTCVRMLILVLANGYGCIHMTIGPNINRVVIFGLLYLVTSTIEGINRLSLEQKGAKSISVWTILLALCEVVMCVWVAIRLTRTQGELRGFRTKGAKESLQLYRIFGAMLVSILFIGLAFFGWSVATHTFAVCLSDWKFLWIDIAFWHILFFAVLSGIMTLWRPSRDSMLASLRELQKLDREDVINIHKAVSFGSVEYLYPVDMSKAEALQSSPTDQETFLARRQFTR